MGMLACLKDTVKPCSLVSDQFASIHFFPEKSFFPQSFFKSGRS